MIQQAVLFLSLLSLLTYANDSRTIMLWKIEHRSLAKPSFLFGTYHSRDKKINDLPGKVLQVLASTQTLYTETNMTDKSRLTIQTFMQSPHAIPLRKRLNASTYRRLQKHIHTSNIPLSTRQLSAFKTWAIALLLNNHAESKGDTDTLFMDERLVAYAHKAAVLSLGLETPQEQLIYFEDLSSQEQELLLVDSMNQTENDSYKQALKTWYINGELSGFKEIQETFKDCDPTISVLDDKLFDFLLTERNARFIQRMHRILQKNPQENYFFAIGAGHLAGVNGLIEGLRKKGYQLQKAD